MARRKKHHTPYEDPDVTAALADGRRADDITVIACPDCHQYGYYNQGSHFHCRWCEFEAVGDALDELIDGGDVITLDDYAEMMVVEDGLP